MKKIEINSKITSYKKMDLETLQGRISYCASKTGSRDTLAQLSGVPRRTLDTYINGTEPKVNRVVAIADAAQVPLQWLATGEGAPDQVAEQTVEYASSIDHQRLQHIVEDLDRYLADVDKSVSPEQKGRLISALYGMSPSGKIPPDLLAQLAELAAS